MCCILQDDTDPPVWAVSLQDDTDPPVWAVSLHDDTVQKLKTHFKNELMKGTEKIDSDIKNIPLSTKTRC